MAVSSVIGVPPEYHQDYFDSEGEMVNPWRGRGDLHPRGVALRGSSAHSPMIESEEVESDRPRRRGPSNGRRGGLADLPAIDPQGAAAKSADRDRPRGDRHPSIVTARDVSCLIIPDGCLGLPVLAALEQGIPVIAVRDRSILVRNDLSALPWAPGQFRLVENYLEAVGVLCALRAGLSLDSVTRPILPTQVTEVTQSSKSFAWLGGQLPRSRQWKRETRWCFAMTTMHVATLTFVAVDLTRSEEHNRLWRKQKTAVRSSREFYPGLPRGGLATAVGYWFAETKVPLDPDAFRVDVLPCGERGIRVEPETESAATQGTPEQRHFPTVILTAESYRGKASSSAEGFPSRLAPNGRESGLMRRNGRRSVRRSC